MLCDWVRTAPRSIYLGGKGSSVLGALTHSDFQYPQTTKATDDVDMLILDILLLKMRNESNE